MTDAQKEAAVERLRIAREKRGITGAASIHESIRNLPEDSKIHWKKVKQWIKSCEEELRGMREHKKSKDWNLRQEYISLEIYIKNLKTYLSSGVYLDYRFGEKREGRMQEVCLQLAYYPDGQPKRSIGVMYPDIGQIWTREMENEVYGKDNQPKRIYRREEPEVLVEEDVQSDG